MALENLFAAEPQLPNVHKTKLPENPEKWAEVLTTQVREQFPDVSKLPINIEFRKRDDQSGTAIGAVHIISLEANKSVYVPFVIEKFQMHPLDIWMEKGTQAVHPLTKDTFKEIFFIHNVAEGLDARPSDSMGNYFNDPSMWSQTYPPLQGRYSYASAGYQILDEISDTMTEEDISNLKAELTSSPMLLAKFEQNGHKEIIQKLASKKSFPKKKDFKASAMQLIPTSVMDVKKEGKNKYSIISSADGIFDLSNSVNLTRNECEAQLSKISPKPQDILNDVDLNGEKFIVAKPAEEGVFLFDKNEVEAKPATQFGAYALKNKNGLSINGMVIPEMIDFEGKKISGCVVIAHSHSCVQDKVAGVPLEDFKDSHELLKPKKAHVGQTGSFVFVHKEKAIATKPVTIKAIENNDLLHVVDLYGKEFRVRLGWGDQFETVKNINHNSLSSNSETIKQTASLESLGFVEVKKDHFVIPGKMAWIPLEPMTDLVASPSEWMEKTAMSKMDINPIEMRYTGIVYELKGGNLPKTASLNERSTKVMLANLGMDQEKIAKAIHKAKHTGKCKIHGSKKLKEKEEVESKAEEAQEKVAQACKQLKKSLVKHAAAIDDKATVDVILSLGFLNPDNLAKFVSYIPVLEKSADFLAEITLAGRLGLKQVDQAATTGAMSKLMEVVEGLKKISSSMKKTAGVASEAVATALHLPASVPLVLGGVLSGGYKNKGAVEDADEKMLSNFLIPGLGGYRLGRRLVTHPDLKKKKTES